MSSPISTLPEERLEEILQKSFHNPSDGSLLLLVCTQWKRLMLPHVYHTVFVNPKNHSQIKERFEGPGGAEVVGFVKRLIAISGGAGSGLDGGAFGRILDLFPSVEDVIVGHFWHQWFRDAYKLSSNFKHVKSFIWHSGYSPLPNPDPALWIGQFSTWDSLEYLELRGLSFMGGSQSSEYYPYTDSPAPSKLRHLRIDGNLIPPHQLCAALNALRVPLTKLELANIALLGPAGICDALRIVGKSLKLLVVEDDGRLSAIGNVSDGLLIHMKTLCPDLEELVLAGFPISVESFQHLPAGLVSLSAPEPSLTGDALISGLGELKELKKLTWCSILDTWDKQDTESVLRYCEERGIKGNVMRLQSEDEG